MKGTVSAYLAALVVFAGGAAHAADWPAFMGGPGRTGEAVDSRIRPPLKLLWRFRTDGSVRGSICVVDRVAYACSRDGSVYALDAKTGGLVWRKQLGALERATASVAHGKVFVALNAYKDGKVFALDAKTGDEVWSRAIPTRNITRTGPLVVDDAVITFCWIEEEKKSGFICLEAAGGEVRWRVTGRHELVGDPSSDGKTVFFATAEGGRDKPAELLAVEVKTGKVLWRNDRIAVDGIPTIANYGISVYGGVLYFTGKEHTSRWGRLFAVNAATGEKIWESPALGRGGYPAVPAVTEKIVYPRTAAVDRATGKMLWSFPLKVTSCGPAVVANGYVFFGTSTGVRANGLARGPWVNPREGLTALPRIEGASKVYILDAATGEFAGDFQVMNRVCSAMAIVDDVLYFGSYDGCIYALVHDEKGAPAAAETLVEVKTDLTEAVRPDPAAQRWYDTHATSWPMFRHDARRTGAVDVELETKGLALAWSVDLGAEVRSSPAVVDGRIYIGSDDGHLHCLELKDGKAAWKFRTGGPVRSSPAVWEKRVYVGSNDHRLYCVSADGGVPLWTFEAADEIESSPCVFEGVVYFGSLDRRLYALDARSGAKKWVFTSFGCITASPAVTDETVSFGGWDSRIYCLSRRDGTPRWGRVVEDLKGNPQGGCILSSPAVSGGTLVITGDDPFNGVGAYDLATGEQLWWARRSVAVKSSPAVASGRVFHGSERTFDCHVLDTGEELWHRWPIQSFYSSPAVTPSAVFVGAVDGKLYALSRDRNEMLWQFKTGGPIRSSPSVGEGVLAVGSDDHRLYVFKSAPAGPADAPKP